MRWVPVLFTTDCNLCYSNLAPAVATQVASLLTADQHQHNLASGSTNQSLPPITFNDDKICCIRSASSLLPKYYV